MTEAIGPLVEHLGVPGVAVAVMAYVLTRAVEKLGDRIVEKLGELAAEQRETRARVELVRDDVRDQAIVLAANGRAARADTGAA